MLKRNTKKLTAKRIIDSLNYKQVLIGQSDITKGNHYMIILSREVDSISHEIHEIRFDFHDNIMNKSGIKDWLYCLLLGSNTYEEILNFGATSVDRQYYAIREFGCKTYKDAQKLIRALKQQNGRVKFLFNSSEILTLQRYFNNY